MPTELSIPRHLEGLREAMVAFVRYAERAGLAADVPTCPGWTVRDLVAHQGMVHRWAAALLRGEQVEEPEAFEREGLRQADPLEWLRDGAVELDSALAHPVAGVTPPVFLKDAPAPGAFWARRQCHETTIHAVDALSAALGRLPSASEMWFDAELACDGVDELLAGFLPRSKSRLRTEQPTTQVIEAIDRPYWWSLALSLGPTTTMRHDRPVAEAAATWHHAAPAVELYLQLWNRAAVPADTGLMPEWSSLAVISW